MALFRYLGFIQNYIGVQTFRFGSVRIPINILRRYGNDAPAWECILFHNFKSKKVGVPLTHKTQDSIQPGEMMS